MTRYRSLEELRATVGDHVRAQLEPAPPVVPPRRKYLNQPGVSDGIRFDSKLELARYHELLREKDAGAIDFLDVHPSFALNAPRPDGELIRIGSYEADFCYARDGRIKVEDCKSARTRATAIYQWKRRHFEVQYGYEIIEVMRPWRATRKKIQS